jgi:hypothetical protein
MGKGSSNRYSAPSRGESQQFVPQSASAYQAFPNSQREQTYNFKSDVDNTLAGLGAIFNSFQQPSAQQPQYLSNPYSQPVNNILSPYFNPRYVPTPRMVPQQFVPQSARNYVSPFSGFTSKEQTYYDLTRGTKPPPAPVKTVTAPAESVAAPAFDYGYSDYVAGATGGVVKAATGRYLQGPGDGTSDSIPATIGNAQPARLADGEFVIDARTVSEIGNGSSNAGAKKLYAMMERVHRERKKAKRGQDSNADRFLPR